MLRGNGRCRSHQNSALRETISSFLQGIRQLDCFELLQSRGLMDVRSDGPTQADILGGLLANGISTE